MPNVARIGFTYDDLVHLFSGGLDSNLELAGYRPASPTCRQLLTAKDMVASHDYDANQWDTRSLSKSAETYVHSLEHLEGTMSTSLRQKTLLPHMIVSTIKMDVTHWCVARKEMAEVLSHVGAVT
jgi:hypothetical protein